MTAIHPDTQATAVAAGTITPDAPSTRGPGVPEPEVHAGVQLGATLIAAGLILAAIVVAPFGAWWSVPIAVLAVAIFAGAILPDLLGARLDRARAAEDAEAGE